VQRVFCIGQNYAKHVQELNSEIPEQPVIFAKPPTCLVEDGATIQSPKHGKDFHFEAELVILIGKDGKPENLEDAYTFISGVSLGLDLTLRDVQSRLKKKGLPWEIAKAFDQSAPVGRFVPYSPQLNLKDMTFTCHVNGELRQKGHTKDMIFGIDRLILALGGIWKLKAGDLLYTGTPSGVGPLKPQDRISVSSPMIGSFLWEIA